MALNQKDPMLFFL